MSNPNIARDSSKTFKKGQSGNPKGKPPGALSMTTKIREFLMSEAPDGETYADKLKKAGVLRAITKSDVLFKEIMDRVDGKVVTPTDITSGGEKIVYIPSEVIDKYKLNEAPPSPSEDSQ